MNIRPLLLGALLVVVPALALLAAAPKKKPTPAPADARPPTVETASSPATSAAPARLRIWKGDFPSKRSVRLSLRSAGKGATPLDLGTFEAGSHFSDYVDAPAGAGTLEVRAPEGKDEPLAKLSTQLASGTCATLILLEDAAGTLKLELVDDTPTGDALSSELFVRNFIPGLDTLQLDGGPDLHIRLGTAGSFLHLRGLPRTPLQLETTGKDREGAQIHWSNEVDFRQIRRATLLIVTDPYGRIRPRIFIDSTNPPDPASPPPAVPAGEAR